MTQIEAARIQIDRAIELFITQADLVSAIVLAGGAENLLREKLQSLGRINALEILSEAVSHLSQNKLDPKEFIRGEQSVKNWLKHHSDTDLEFEPWDQASFVIDRAIQNYEVLTQTRSAKMEEYEEHMGV